MKRHPPPWTHKPCDRAKIPPKVMEEILSEGTSPRIAGSITRRGRPSELIDHDDIDRPAIALEDQRSRPEYVDEALNIMRVHEPHTT